MSLTPEQLELRKHGIGASEIAAVLGMSPWSTPLEVWMRKSTPTRGPLVEPKPTVNTTLGHVLEPALRQHYIDETGIEVVEGETMQHPIYPHVLATPDGLSIDGRSGLEIKCVGSRMVWRDWQDGEVLPPYVKAQCYLNLAVTGREFWDVAAHLGGTDFQIFNVRANAEIQNEMVQAAHDFWCDYVLTDTEPPCDDPEKVALYLKAFYKKTEGKVIEQPTDTREFHDLCKSLKAAQDTEKRATEEVKKIKNLLSRQIGNNHGIETSLAKVTWGNEAGAIKYKDLAIELAGGTIPPLMLEKHRGDSKRVMRFTHAKELI